MSAGRKPSAADLRNAYGGTIRDVIADELDVVFVGINPGLYSAAVGHHFARPGNRFWPALYDGGFTDRLLSPAEERLLLAFGCGVTNFVNRATGRADELSREELVAGAKNLTRKVQRRRPLCVAVLGVTAYRTAFQIGRAQLGRQKQRLGSAAVWVLPNPSGLNAHYQRADFARLFAELRRGIARERNSR